MVQKFEQTPPPAAVDAELRAMGVMADDRYPPGFVRMPDSSTKHWTEALAWMRRRAQAFGELSRFQQTPFYRSPTFLAFAGGLAVLLSLGVTLIEDPRVAVWIPEPWNKILPLLLSIGVVPRMQKWWQEYRTTQERELADQRRLFAAGMTEEQPPPPQPQEPKP